jgi:hypothetical protein
VDLETGEATTWSVQDCQLVYTFFRWKHNGLHGALHRVLLAIDSLGPAVDGVPNTPHPGQFVS